MKFRLIQTANILKLLCLSCEQALNNHEFDGGVKILENFINQVQFPILSCTLDASNEPVLNGLFVKSLVLKFGSDKVGLVGFTHSSARQISNPGEIINIMSDLILHLSVCTFYFVIKPVFAITIVIITTFDCSNSYNNSDE